MVRETTRNKANRCDGPHGQNRCRVYDSPRLRRSAHIADLLGFFHYRNTLTTGIADNDFFYGDQGDQIITGGWVQDPTKGPDTVGIFRPSNGRFYLWFENSRGNAKVDYRYGNSNMAAVAGHFGTLPGGDAQRPGTDTTTTTLPNCDPSYPDFCIPPPPPDLNCGDIGKMNFTVLRPDPHGFDGNKNGIGCES